MKKLGLSCLRLLSFLTILGLTVNVFGQSEPRWKSTFKKEINWLKVAPTGHLIASTDEGLMGIDRENGEVIWRREDLKKLKSRPEEFKSFIEEFVPFTPYAILRIFSGANKTFKHSGMPYYISLINVLDGKDMWSTEALGLKDHYGYLFVPEMGGLFLYAKDKDKKKTAFVLALESGNVIWQKRDFFKKRDPALFDVIPSEDEGGSSEQTIKGNQSPYYDTAETMITFMYKKAIRKFNAKTGELVWETEIKAKKPPAVRNGYAPMLLSENKDVLYAACAKTVYAVRTQDGSLVWEKPPKLKGGIAQMRLTSHGLIVKGASVDDGKVKVDDKPFLALIDPETGKALWNNEYKKLKGGTNYVIKDDKIMVFANRRLFAINLSDGAVTEMAKNLTFEGKETPAFMMLRDDGYYLQSSTNLMLVSFDGKKVFHTYHKAPKLSLLEKMALGVATRLVFETMGALDETVFKGWESSGTDEKTASKMVSEFRFKDTKNLETYIYMLTQIETENEKGVGFVKVNKINGETEDQIILGTRTTIY